MIYLECILMDLPPLQYDYILDLLTYPPYGHESEKLWETTFSNSESKTLASALINRSFQPNIFFSEERHWNWNMVNVTR